MTIAEAIEPAKSADAKTVTVISREAHQAGYIAAVTTISDSEKSRFLRDSLGSCETLEELNGVAKGLRAVIDGTRHVDVENGELYGRYISEYLKAVTETLRKEAGRSASRG